ncbi:MAG: chromate efflux transporter [Verrucomicrobia bacterium]|nr:chromate efflux transporter [Verrucomicrobiota bacterium]
MTTAISQKQPHPLAELAWLFLKLGTIGFGGPAAHIAMMRDEVVRRRQWLTDAEFLDLLGATNLIPGPNSTEMAIHVGQKRAGFPGLVVAGACFIVPAMVIVLACAWAYVRFGTLPQAQAVLYGVKPAIITIVVQALWALARSAVKTKFLAATAIAATVLSALCVNELVVLLAAGLVVPAIRSLERGSGESGGVVGIALLPFSPRRALLAVAGPGAAAGAVAQFGLWPMFLFFLKVGSVLFGSGYVLLAFLRADLVDRWHWLTESQLLDAVAVGQITPGPVFTTATFIGYLLGGVPAGLLATLGIFLPAFFFVAISGPLVPRMRRSPAAGAFLDGVNVASLALMAVVTWQLGRVAVCDWLTVALAIVSGVLLFRYRVNSAWLVLGGAVAGVLASVCRTWFL